MYRALRVVNPSPYMIYMQARGAMLVASSPEILCRVTGDGTVVNRPLAGTRKRGANAEEDLALEKDLLVRRFCWPFLALHRTPFPADAWRSERLFVILVLCAQRPCDGHVPSSSTRLKASCDAVRCRITRRRTRRSVRST